MDTGALVLVPPALVLIMALLTRNVTISLLLGIFSAGFIASNFTFSQTVTMVIQRLISQTGIPELLHKTGSYDQAVMFGFLMCLGILIEFLSHTGGLRVYTKTLLKRIHSGRGAQLVSLLLSCCFFIDDYFNALMVGSIMRPITDHYRICRAKLAYLINAVTSPLAVIIPASSWVGMMLTQFEASGVTKVAASYSLIVIDPFHLYLSIVPFLFYPFLSIITAWFMVTRNISYGLMHKFETTAEQTGNLFGDKEPLPGRAESLMHHGSSSDIMLPLSLFIIVCMSVILYTGNYYLFGGTHSLFKAFMSGNTVLGLFSASFSAALVSGVSCLIKKQASLKKLGQLTVQGYFLMQNSILILWLAWTLSTLLENDLHTGQYIAPFLLKVISISMMPLIFFLVATMTSISTGSSWGTISFLIPLALPLMVNLVGHPPLDVSHLSLVAPVIAAILSGAIAGCQLSPITDATVMASASAACYHMDHAQTMASYSLAPLLGSTVAFFLSGLLFQYSYLLATIISLICGMIASIAFIYLRKYKK